MGINQKEQATGKLNNNVGPDACILLKYGKVKIGNE